MSTTVNRSFSDLIDDIDTKARSIATTTENAEDLVYLGKTVEALNLATTVSDVIDEGDAQVARIEAEGDTQDARIEAEGANQLNIIKDAGSIPVTTKAVGSTLEKARINVTATTGTYYLPLANSVSEGEYVIVEKPDASSSATPKIAVASGSSDEIIYSQGEDTEVNLDLARAVTLRFTSNGTDSWRI